MEIIYKKGSLFDAPKGSMLLHSCNCQGSWGNGIAKQLKMRFPLSYNRYVKSCYMDPSGSKDHLLGSMDYFADNGFIIVCLYASERYGRNTNPEHEILNYTKEALIDLLNEMDYMKYDNQIHMPKINSGYFKVPWEKTENIIKEIDNNRTITVWELD